MVRWIREHVRCDSGSTAMEYSIVAAMIALVIIGAVTSAGADLMDIFQGLAESP